MTADYTDPPAPREEPYRDIECLIRAMHAELCRIAYLRLWHHADAEDAVQRGCINVSRSWATVGHFDTAAQQRAYLVRTVINEALQIRRQPHRERESLTGEDVEATRLPGPLGGEGPVSREDLYRVLQAISKLPTGKREVMALFVAGYEYSEIAEMLGISLSAVSSHMSAARKRLRETFGQWKGGFA